MLLLEATYTLELQRFMTGDERVLVAVSGGADSMVLLRLTVQTLGAERVAVAHCNFSLRPGEADHETDLVAQTAEALGVKCHVARFDTPAICASTGESTQLAARRLRYDFFERLCEMEGYSYVFVGHNTDDTIETFLINLLRGTGLRGLCGIPRKNGRVVRPLLSVTRSEIETYAVQTGVEYMTDSSNLSDKYLRNKLRHNVLPVLREISPGLDATMLRNLEGLRAHDRFERDAVAQIAQRVVSERGISIDGLLAEPTASPFLLYKLLEEYGFNFETASDIFRQLGELQTGRKFFARDFAAFVDRGYIAVCERVEAEAEVRLLTSEEVELRPYEAGAVYRSGVGEAFFDADLLAFPLEVRVWRAGDRVRPYGMGGRAQKVSDLLTNAKVSAGERGGVRVVVSGGVVVWVVGLRTAEDAKVTPETKTVARVML